MLHLLCYHCVMSWTSALLLLLQWGQRSFEIALPILVIQKQFHGIICIFRLYLSALREETGSLQVANKSKYATQSLRSKSLHEIKIRALTDWDSLLELQSMPERSRYVTKRCQEDMK